MQLPRSSPLRQDRSQGQREANDEQVSVVTARREALEELLQTDGWKLFVAHVLNECQGGGYFASMTGAFATGDPQLPKVIHLSAQGILRLIEWPREQVESLKGSVDDE